MESPINQEEAISEQAKPLWIPIVGYLIIALALGSLGSMVVSWFSDDPSIDLGFLFIWAGAGFIQRHRTCAKIIAGFSILLAIVALIILLAILIGGVDPTYSVHFFGSETLLKLTAIIISLVILGLSIWLPVTIHRNKQLFTNNKASFHIKSISRNAIPPVVTIVILSVLLAYSEYTIMRHQQTMENIEQFEIEVHPIDAETGEIMKNNVGHSTSVIHNGGYSRMHSTRSSTDGITLNYMSTPPLKAVIHLTREGYEDTDYEFETTESTTVEIKMKREANEEPTTKNQELPK